MHGPGAFMIAWEERGEMTDVMESGDLSRYGSEDDPRFGSKAVTLEQKFARKAGVKNAMPPLEPGGGPVRLCFRRHLTKPSRPHSVPDRGQMSHFRAQLPR
jgi:hypothetical protein